MALTETNVQLYMEGLCKIATGGNVSVNFAWLAKNRMELYCNKCKQTLTAPKPEDTTVDYAVQEFLKLHLHKVHPEYCACEQCLKPIKQAALAAKAVTADFKPVGSLTEDPDGWAEYSAAHESAITKPDAVVMTNIQAPDPDGYGLTNLPKVKPPALNYDKDAPYLAEKLKSVQQEYAQKLNDVALANKIKLLQLSSQEQAKIQQAKQLAQQAQTAKEAVEQQMQQVTAEDLVKPLFAPLPVTYYSKEAVEKLKYKLAEFNWKKPLQIIKHEPYVAPPAPTPAPKKEKPLRQVTGRKIR